MPRLSRIGSLMKDRASRKRRDRSGAKRLGPRAPSGVAASGPEPARGGAAWALLLTLPLALALLPSGWFFGHDNMALIRLFEQDVMLRAGQFPVRWYPDVAGGYGSPHPQYYAPLFYLIAQIFHLAGCSLTLSLKLTIIVVVGGASVGIFLLTREFVGRGGGLLAAALYSYAPYHMLDLFVRTAFSELTVFAALPFVLLGFHRLAWGATPRRIAGAAAALGALCLSHTITVMLIPPLLGAYILLLARRVRFRRSFMLPVAGAGLLGICLAAFFLIPLVIEKDAVETEIYTGGYFSYGKHFVSPSQLLFSSWGHGMSREGPGDGFSFRLGALQIMGCLAAALWWPALRRAFPGAAHLIIYAGLVSLAGIFMALAISKPIWTLAPPLRYVQFPWRFLILPAFGMPLIGGLALPLLWRRREEKAAPGTADLPASLQGNPVWKPPSDPIPRWAVAVMCAVVVSSSAGMFGFRRWIPFEQIGFGGDHMDMKVRDADEAFASPTVFTREFIRKESLHWFDHLPHGGYPYPPARDAERPRAEIAIGAGSLEVISEAPARYLMQTRSTEEITLRINVYRFPGWILRVDGKPVEPGPLLDRRPVLSLAVPVGEHLIEASFERTPARWAGDLVSLSAFAVLVGLLAAGFRNRAGPRGSAASGGS